MREKLPAVYILASRRNGTLYIGVTSDVLARTWHHRDSVTPGFSSRYGVKRLVYYELHATMPQAIKREKAMKKWRRGFVSLPARANWAQKTKKAR